MLSKVTLVGAFFFCSLSVILSLPQFQILPIAVPEEQVEENEVHGPHPVQEQLVVADNVPQLQPRTFGSLFNLSAYLANAPTNMSALNFVPLITLLAAKG